MWPPALCCVISGLAFRPGVSAATLALWPSLLPILVSSSAPTPRSAWHSAAPEEHPFLLEGAEMEAAAAAVPSPAAVEATLSAPPALDEIPGAAEMAAQAAVTMDAPPPEADPEPEPVWAPVPAPPRRPPPPRARSRRPRYEARRSGVDKRPRIKGRFVSRAELDSLIAQGLYPAPAGQVTASASADRQVPSATVTAVAAC